MGRCSHSQKEEVHTPKADTFKKKPRSRGSVKSVGRDQMTKTSSTGTPAVTAVISAWDMTEFPIHADGL